MRISLELERADNPRLFDELARFPKGPRRVNRLRTLAYDGFIGQFALVPHAPEAASHDGQQPCMGNSGNVGDRAMAALELFEPAIESGGQ
ncbi:hypothetical protein GJ700_02520 [Duganella sp. FT92W]|uniref:Uncharacterized protein n=1 Tax=Pseudoduganella rivuli TaxID=2666085 RepID=A0A7X2LR98_9BURK|nr:hypothetical protein [Pseudoduganella rivuli]MRV70593.1 hypothetical protein [Pseudoduganella rivuli]